MTPLALDDPLLASGDPDPGEWLDLALGLVGTALGAECATLRTVEGRVVSRWSRADAAPGGLEPARLVVPITADDRPIAALELIGATPLPFPANTARKAARLVGFLVPALLRALDVPDLATHDTDDELLGLVGESAAMRRLRLEVRRAARLELPALIVGERGSGKEVVARAIHALGPRASGPFVVLGAATITDELIAPELLGHVRGAFAGAIRSRAGLIEAASGGSILIDDPAALSPTVQAVLLRVLEDRAVRPIGGSRLRPLDARLLIAAPARLEQEVAAGRLRSDLRWRLQGLELAIPPLRERPEDLAPLVELLLRRHADEAGLARPLVVASAREALLRHTWPGNVRELENEVRRWVALGVSRVLPGHLACTSGPPPPPPGCGLDAELEALERRLLTRAMDETGGNVSRAARRLGIERTRLLRRLRKLGLRNTPASCEDEAS